MKNLFKALAKFQQEVPVILKDTQGYGYKYADLPAIFDVINPLLEKHKLGFTQLIEGTSIKTILFHIESAEQIESTTDIPQGVSLKGMNDFQVLGSAITYIRRYALSSMLGLVTDKDTDASGQQRQQTATASNTISVPNNVLADVSKKLAEVKSKEELESLGKSELQNIKKYPQIKTMFTSKKLALNGN